MLKIINRVWNVLRGWPGITKFYREQMYETWEEARGLREIKYCPQNRTLEQTNEEKEGKE